MRDTTHIIHTLLGLLQMNEKSYIHIMIIDK